MHAPPERVARWLVPGARAEAGPPRRGTRFRHVAEALGLRWESEAVVEEAATGAVAFRQLAGDYDALRGRCEVRAEGGGARVRVRLELALPYVLPRLTTEAEVRRAWSEHVDALLVRLKRKAEA